MACLRKAKFVIDVTPMLFSCITVQNFRYHPAIPVTHRSLITTKCFIPALPAPQQHYSLNTSTHHCMSNSDDDEDEGEAETEEQSQVVDMINGVRLSVRGRAVRDIPVETSIKYMRSEAYKSTYGDKPVWVPYRRNFSGQFAPATRKRCIRKGLIATGSACPICRDDYLVVDYRNVELIKQFVSPHTGLILRSLKTHVCQRAQQYLEIAIERAWEEGLLVHDVPFRKYSYEDYYPAEMLQPGYQYNAGK